MFFVSIVGFLCFDVCLPHQLDRDETIEMIWRKWSRPRDVLMPDWLDSPSEDESVDEEVGARRRKFRPRNIFGGRIKSKFTHWWLAFADRSLLSMFGPKFVVISLSSVAMWE